MKDIDSSYAANRLGLIKPSGLRKLFDLEQAISKTSNTKILSFGLGNLNIPISKPIIDKFKDILDDPRNHRYSPNAGLPELREAIVEKYKNLYDLDYKDEDIIVTSGCLEALLDTFLANVNPGDEVLIQDPTFGYYANQIKLCGGKVRPIPLNEKFELDAELLNNSITKKTKFLVFNFPCNPTGSVMDRASIKAVIETATDSGVTVISDEAYESLTYNDHKHTCAAEFDQQNVILLSSFSKTFAMTGLRIGYVVAPPKFLKPISLVHQINTACANTPSQLAASYALSSYDSFVRPLVEELDKRRQATVKAFTSIDGIKLSYQPLGAFYIYPDISGTGMTGSEFSEYLLKECQIIVVPGTEFGLATPNNVRISYGFLNISEIEEAGARMLDILQT
ncbi:MAG: pyridoxal phosphate-dependent aminotransferase [Candidatus Hodarchaeales archaeon]